LIDPRLGAAIRFADIGANLQCPQIVHHRSTVVTLVGDDRYRREGRTEGVDPLARESQMAPNDPGLSVPTVCP
jgi:hypothetical protein